MFCIELFALFLEDATLYFWGLTVLTIPFTTWILGAGAAYFAFFEVDFFKLPYAALFRLDGDWLFCDWVVTQPVCLFGDAKRFLNLANIG